MIEDKNTEDLIIKGLEAAVEAGAKCPAIIDMMPAKRYAGKERYLIIVSVRSEKEAQSIAMAVMQAIAEAGGVLERVEPPMPELADWLIVAFDSQFSFEIFTAARRSKTNLERTWVNDSMYPAIAVEVPTELSKRGLPDEQWWKDCYAIEQ